MLIARQVRRKRLRMALVVGNVQERMAEDAGVIAAEFSQLTLALMTPLEVGSFRRSTRLYY